MFGAIHQATIDFIRYNDKITFFSQVCQLQQELPVIDGTGSDAWTSNSTRSRFWGGGYCHIFNFMNGVVISIGGYPNRSAACHNHFSSIGAEAGCSDDYPSLWVQNRDKSQVKRFRDTN